MRILGIESSCDETAAAVVEDGRILRSNIVASSAAEQNLYGGVVPEIASRRHIENISGVAEAALLPLVDEPHGRIVLEVFADQLLVMRNDDDDFIRPRALRLLDDQVERRPVADREHLLRDDFRRRKKSGAESGRWNECFHFSIW